MSPIQLLCHILGLPHKNLVVWYTDIGAYIRQLVYGYKRYYPTISFVTIYGFDPSIRTPTLRIPVVYPDAEVSFTPFHSHHFI